MVNKKGRFMILWILVAMYFFFVIIAMIEPLKLPLTDAMTGLSCSSTTNNFIKPVCFLLQGGVVLFVGTFLWYLVQWVIFNSAKR